MTMRNPAEGARPMLMKTKNRNPMNTYREPPDPVEWDDLPSDVQDKIDGEWVDHHADELLEDLDRIVRMIRDGKFGAGIRDRLRKYEDDSAKEHSK